MITGELHLFLCDYFVTLLCVSAKQASCDTYDASIVAVNGFAMCDDCATGHIADDQTAGVCLSKSSSLVILLQR